MNGQVRRWWDWALHTNAVYSLMFHFCQLVILLGAGFMAIITFVYSLPWYVVLIAIVTLATAIAWVWGTISTMRHRPQNIPSIPSGMGRSDFVGRWCAGIGCGSETIFIIHLNDDGTAQRDLAGMTNGRWNYINGEAVAQWEDGGIDVLRCLPEGGVLKLAFPAGMTTPHNTSMAVKET